MGVMGVSCKVDEVAVARAMQRASSGRSSSVIV